MTKKVSPHVAIGRALLTMFDVDAAIKDLGNLIVDKAHAYGFFHKTNPEGYNTLFRQVLRYLREKKSAKRRKSSACHTAHVDRKTGHVDSDAPVGQEILKALGGHTEWTIDDTLGHDCD